MFFFFKQKTAYEMRISDWSSDVCSSDLRADVERGARGERGGSREKISLSGIRRRGVGSDRQGLLAEHDPLDLRYLGAGQRHRQEIGRASCRERVCQYV